MELQAEEACYDIVQRILKNIRREGMQVGFLAMNVQGEYGGYSVYNGLTARCARKIAMRWWMPNT